MRPTLQDLHRAWTVEAESIEEDDEDRAAAECAMFPDEVDAALKDVPFEGDWEDAIYEWDVYIFQRMLRLALERACNEGILLQGDLLATRLQSCPPGMLQALKIFLTDCPLPVLCAVANYNYHLVRLERVKRTGQIDWSPTKAALAATGRAV